MEESSDYEKRIKDKREQNKNKLKELGLTPILDNIASATPKYVISDLKHLPSIYQL